MENAKSAIYIISSPLQALCAIEAKLKFNFYQNYFFITYLSEQLKSKSTIINVLNNFGINSYREIVLPKYYNYLKYLIINLRKSIKYDYIFIGDYFNTSYYLLALIFKKRDSKLIFLDDGNSTIEAFIYKFKYAKNRGISYYLRYLITKIICMPVFINSKTFFTIFSNTNTKHFSVIKNEFEIIKYNLLNNNVKNESGVIIGSNFAEMGFLKEEEYIKVLLDVIKKYPQTKNIYYFPHRNENKDKLNNIMKLTNIIICENNSCIELEIVNKNINPKFIIGFGSTALYSLKILYPTSNIIGYIIKLRDDYLNVIYEEIWKEYIKKGINVFQLLNTTKK